MSTRFGSLIFHKRNRKRIAQKAIAYAAGIDPSYLASVERGRRPPPRRETVDRLLTALSMSPSERVIAVEAAALDRLVPAIQESEADIRGAAALIGLCEVLPQLNQEKTKVLADLFAALSDERVKEEPMS